MSHKLYFQVFCHWCSQVSSTKWRTFFNANFFIGAVVESCIMSHFDTSGQIHRDANTDFVAYISHAVIPSPISISRLKSTKISTNRLCELVNVIDADRYCCCGCQSSSAVMEMCKQMEWKGTMQIGTRVQLNKQEKKMPLAWNFPFSTLNRFSFENAMISQNQRGFLLFAAWLLKLRLTGVFVYFWAVFHCSICYHHRLLHIWHVWLSSFLFGPFYVSHFQREFSRLSLDIFVCFVCKTQFQCYILSQQHDKSRFETKKSLKHQRWFHFTDSLTDFQQNLNSQLELLLWSESREWIFVTATAFFFSNKFQS